MDTLLSCHGYRSQKIQSDSALERFLTSEPPVTPLSQQQQTKTRELSASPITEYTSVYPSRVGTSSDMSSRKDLVKQLQNGLKRRDYIGRVVSSDSTITNSCCSSSGTPPAKSSGFRKRLATAIHSHLPDASPARQGQQVLIVRTSRSRSSFQLDLDNDFDDDETSWF